MVFRQQPSTVCAVRLATHFPERDLTATLPAMGHDIRIAGGFQRAIFGRGQIIQRLSGGVWAAGSDPRADGHAAAQV